MKTLRVMLGIVATLFGGTVVSQAHGCGFPFLPFWSFGLGWGLGAATTMATVEPCPIYTCARPAWTYSTEYVQTPVQNPAPAQEPPPEPPAPAYWIPSTPGLGHWVPDSTPYSYTPKTAEHGTMESVQPSTIKMTSFPGNVRVYVVTH